MRWASTRCASPAPIRRRARAPRSTPSSPMAVTATWRGSPPIPSAARSPRAIWPDVKSIIMLGMSYGPERDPLAALSQRSRGTISVYAQGADYHDVIKSKLKSTRFARAGRGARRGEGLGRHRAGDGEADRGEGGGIGWQGKHTNLVSRDFGSWLFLGAIFTTAEIDPGRAGRQTIAAPAAAASTSARPMRSQRPTSSMRGAASPTSPSSTKGTSRPSIAKRWATASMAATTASPSVPGTNSRASRTKRN